MQFFPVTVAINPYSEEKNLLLHILYLEKLQKYQNLLKFELAIKS